MKRLTQRADFVAAASGSKAHTEGFVVQRRDRGDTAPPRVGFTVSRQVGNAVERNRVRRRLRELVKRSGSPSLRPHCDYVLVGRRAALGRGFDTMLDDLKSALKRLDAQLTRRAAQSPAA